jgi:hypothetical protein
MGGTKPIDRERTERRSNRVTDGWQDFVRKVGDPAVFETITIQAQIVGGVLQRPEITLAVTVD